MDANLLKYVAFLQTVDSGSFTKAAEALRYSQSGVSRMIADLEREWRVTLLERDRAGVRLTSEGVHLLPYARSLCDAYAALQAQVDNLNGLKTGLIRVGTISSIATHWLPNVIAAFQRDYPQVEYELLLGHYADIEGWILDGRVDCGFLRLPTRAELRADFLTRDPLMAVLPMEHPLAALDPVPIRALEGEPFLLLEKDGKAEISELLERHGVKPHVRLTTVDDYAVMSMVEMGLGISILPALILRRVPYRVATRALDVPAYRELGVAYREQKTASLAVKRFLQYLDNREAPSPRPYL